MAAYIHLNPLRAGLARRLDQNCWTSHRAHLALEVAPEWLTTTTLLEEVGGHEAFATCVRDLRQGHTPRPEAFDAETGWLHRSDRKQAPWSLYATDTKATKGRSAREVVDRICQFAGATGAALARSKQGPGGNPARRFVVWALDRSTGLSQHEIGRRVKMSRSQVCKVLAAMRNKPNAQVRTWQDAWTAEEGRRVSNGAT